MSTSKDKVNVLKFIRGWEPFVTETNEFGFTLPYHSREGIKTAMEWNEFFRGNEDQKSIPMILEGMFEKQSAPWEIAGQPRLEDDPTLLDDLIAFIKGHVWIPDQRYYVVLASWVVDTWIHDYMETSPRLIFYATTRSGKTRALNTLRELSYHGLDLVSPTPAAMYRLIESLHPSLFIDEYQDLDKEIMPHIGVIFKSGFQEGGAVPRCDNDKDRSDVGFYKVYSPLAIGLKNRLPKEDEVNRSITVRMLEKPPTAQVVRRIQKDAACLLRGRLLSLRFKVQTEMVKLEPLKVEASKLAEREIPGKDRTIILDDRSIETAAALLLPSLIVGGESFRPKIDAVLGVVASSQEFSDEGLKDTDEGKAFYAIQAVYRFQDELDQTGMDGKKLRNVSKMTTRAVAEQFNMDLSEQGDDNRDPVKTLRVTNMIKSLGFVLHRGAHSQTYFDPDSFQSTYAVNLRKYGGRGN
ncbi:MAG TPA: hypothetical protein VGK23_08710 [Methanomassiliicoccales archaeon]|jgi:hypothetical protein